MKIQSSFILIIAFLGCFLPYMPAFAKQPASPPVAYTIEPHSPDHEFKQIEYKLYSGPIDGLTSQSDTWTGFLRQDGRDITVDLGQASMLSGVSLEFKQDMKRGILFPEYMTVSQSVDGRKWNHLGQVQSLVSPTDPRIQTRIFSLTFKPQLTRYVKIRFPVDVFVFARKLSFQENPSLLQDHVSILPPEEFAAPAVHPYLQIPGVHDIILLYTGAYGDLGTWKPEDFLPILSYVNPEGNIADKMFDTGLFLPYPGVAHTWEDWKDYLDNLFAPHQQLDALNQAAKRIGEKNPTLKIRPKVILTLPYPDATLERFDDSLLRNIFSKKEDSWENRRTALEAYFERMMKKWEEAQFDYLELVGIYWYKEKIEQSIPQELELVQMAADMVHEEGLPFYWIPFFGSKGVDQWLNLGFDYVFVQPNFYGKQTSREDRMINTAQLAKKYRLGIELELDDRILSNRYFYDLFYKQLNLAHELGIDEETTNAYYIGGSKSVVKAAQSKLPQARQIYDDLYQWIKGSYKPHQKGK